MTTLCSQMNKLLSHINKLCTQTTILLSNESRTTFCDLYVLEQMLKCSKYCCKLCYANSCR